MRVVVVRVALVYSHCAFLYIMVVVVGTSFSGYSVDTAASGDSYESADTLGSLASHSSYASHSSHASHGE